MAKKVKEAKAVHLPMGPVADRIQHGTFRPMVPRGDSFTVHVPDATRADLIARLAELPDDAFSWFVAWTQTAFPYGLDGVQPESRAAIARLRDAGKRFEESHP